MAKRRPGDDEPAAPDQPKASPEGLPGGGAVDEAVDGGPRAENTAPDRASSEGSTAEPEASSLADVPSAAAAPADVSPEAGPAAAASGTAGPGVQPTQRTSSSLAARSARNPLRARLGREAIGVAVLVVLALVCVGLITAVVLKSQGEAATAAREAARYTPPPLSQTPAAGTDSPVIAVVGDESVTGAASGVSADARWTTLLGDRLDAQVVTVAAAGEGYTVRSSDGDTFVESAAKVPTGARVVLFIGGAADDATSTLSLARAATEAFAAAAQRAPDASVVAIGPLFTPSGADSAALSDVRSALQGAARIADVRWVDPVRSKWLGTDIGATSDLDETAERTVATRLRSVVQGEID